MHPCIAETYLEIQTLFCIKTDFPFNDSPFPRRAHQDIKQQQIDWRAGVSGRHIYAYIKD